MNTYQNCKMGFTGTRQNLTKQQIECLVCVTQFYSPSELHHGDCVGGDATIHDVVREHVEECKVVIHPPEYDRYRAYKEGDEVRNTLPYLTRNKNIVDESDMMVATPEQKQEKLRSGTWSTIRYAKKKGKFIVIIFPDGTWETHKAKE